MPILSWMDSSRRPSQLHHCEQINHPVLGWENNVFDFFVRFKLYNKRKFWFFHSNDKKKKIWMSRGTSCWCFGIEWRWSWSWQRISMWVRVKIEKGNFWPIDTTHLRIRFLFGSDKNPVNRNKRKINDLNVHRTLAKIRFLDQSHCVTVSNGHQFGQATNSVFAISANGCDMWAMKVFLTLESYDHVGTSFDVAPIFRKVKARRSHT